MIIFTILKSFISRLIPFIIEHYKAIAFALICLYAFQQHNALNRVKSDYDAHIANDVSAASQRKLENHLKELAHKKEIDKANADAKAELEKYKLNRDRETKRLKDLYENRLDTTGRNWSERVRLEQERAASTGMPTSSSDTSGYTESERECHAAYITLEDACRITTIDFNRLRKWGDSTCDLVGCKK